MEPAKITPMMQQYLRIKERYRDAILFFRLGDFYEMFFEDAETASRILDIALTSRNKNEDSAVPLCGVPYHAAEPYIQKLLDAGHKVAVCEQVEDPKTAKGVVQREVIRVITPGTVTSADALDARDNNFLAAVYTGSGNFALAVTDITTGDFRFTQLSDEAFLFDEIGRVHPKELLVSERAPALRQQLQKSFAEAHVTCLADALFSETAADRLATEKGSGVPYWREGIRAASAVVGYLASHAPDSLQVLGNLEPYVASRYMLLDETTRTNLELVSNYQGDRRGSLLGVIDRTLTPMGARRLRQCLFYPLLDVQAIRERHEGVQELVEQFQVRQELKIGLRKMSDIERLSGRVVTGSALPRDLVAIRETLGQVGAFRLAINPCNARILKVLETQLAEMPEIASLIARAIVDEPPLSVKDGSFIRTGFDAELDELRDMRAHAKEWIAHFEAAERRRTGIQSLKVRYNRVFGYYIEVTKSHLKAVPDNYMRKQTLANGERYITPELKEYEAKILNSQELIEKLEMALLARVCDQIAVHFETLKALAVALAMLDVLLSFAEVAESQHFVRPRVDEGLALIVREGRHPVVEATQGRGRFVPNDSILDTASNQILLLTGPNMAGKSTYMRQIALIVILAQMGSFVPATEARIGIADRIFTRIGATDSLARGESTFMVEMKETANILRHASKRSLILLDEVGRGTSTFDGISIAWAVAERLHDMPERPRTLFATHYHELTDLVHTKERIKNFNFSVKEWQGDVIFLRSLVEGAASHSYGIHVGRLAGLPGAVIERAKEILQNLESGEAEGKRAGTPKSGAALDKPMQMGLFTSSERKWLEKLKNLDVSHLSPIEALNLLHQWSEDVKK
ncbi:MAG TPA: DNA mismatch repair protein MutS [Candidatus Binatia bacterium]|nr:DNA mismatch repair protein MutS [Candidatus Binatia bacterium]